MAKSLKRKVKRLKKTIKKEGEEGVVQVNQHY